MKTKFFVAIFIIFLIALVAVSPKFKDGFDWKKGTEKSTKWQFSIVFFIVIATFGLVFWHIYPKYLKELEFFKKKNN